MSLGIKKVVIILTIVFLVVATIVIALNQFGALKFINESAKDVSVSTNTNDNTNTNDSTEKKDDISHENKVQPKEDQNIEIKRIGEKILECADNFDLKKIPIDDKSRNNMDLTSYAICRAQYSKSLNECDILSGDNKKICVSDVMDFVFATSITELFFNDTQKESCSQKTLDNCDKLVDNLFPSEYITSSNAKNEFCKTACTAFKARSADNFASAIHNTFKRQTPLNTPTESLDKTKNDIFALFSLNAEKCDTSVGKGIDCKNEIYYLIAGQKNNKTECEKMITDDPDIFKDICLAQFESNKIKYCDKFIDEYKLAYCSEAAKMQ